MTHRHPQNKVSHLLVGAHSRLQEHTTALCLLPYSENFHLTTQWIPCQGLPLSDRLKDLNQVSTHPAPIPRLWKTAESAGPPEQAPHPACSPQTFLSLLLSLWREQHSLPARQLHG